MRASIVRAVSHAMYPRIDYNMENTAARMQAATRQLALARISQPNARPLKCATALLLAIAILLVSLIKKAAA